LTSLSARLATASEWGVKQKKSHHRCDGALTRENVARNQRLIAPVFAFQVRDWHKKTLPNKEGFFVASVNIND
jgi:hypothetical protein